MPRRSLTYCGMWLRRKPVTTGCASRQVRERYTYTCIYTFPSFFLGGELVRRRFLYCTHCRDLSQFPVVDLLIYLVPAARFGSLCAGSLTAYALSIFVYRCVNHVCAYTHPQRSDSALPELWCPKFGLERDPALVRVAQSAAAVCGKPAGAMMQSTAGPLSVFA